MISRVSCLSRLFPLFLLLLAYPLFPVLRASQDDEESTGVDSTLQVKMQGTLWETLADNGANPTTWRAVFQYNRAGNPAFRNIRSAARIPRGTLILIPSENDLSAPSSAAAPAAPRPARCTVEDTVLLFGALPTLLIRPARGQDLAQVIDRFCIPPALGDAARRAGIIRNLRSDLADLYRRMGKRLGVRDDLFYIPLHLSADNFATLNRRLEAIQREPELFQPRDLVLPVSAADLRHVADSSEGYLSLAERYAGNLSAFPSSYPYRNSAREHLSYMAQLIRHYNLNQPVWPGRLYFIPEYLAGGRYFEQSPPVPVLSRTSGEIRYGNGLTVSLEYHVTRTRQYWKAREKYLPPMERRLADGSPAFPDMIVWHRTGIDPQTARLLHSRGRSHYSLRYIYRMSACNYYIGEDGRCFLIVDPGQNPRQHAGQPEDLRCFWNGESRISDVSIGIEIEGGFFGDLSPAQLESARRLQQVLRGMYVIPAERVLDHRKVACRRGPGPSLVRGRKADGFTLADRLAMGIDPVLDPDILRGLADPNLVELQQRQTDITDFWYGVQIDPDLESVARLTGWSLTGGLWYRPGSRPLPQTSSGSF